jgi:hypothetical protein
MCLLLGDFDHDAKLCLLLGQGVATPYYWARLVELTALQGASRD